MKIIFFWLVYCLVLNPSLSYAESETEKKSSININEKLTKELQELKSLSPKQRDQRVLQKLKKDRAQAKTDEERKFLDQLIQAAENHQKLSPEERQDKQKRWMEERKQATQQRREIERKRNQEIYAKKKAECETSGGIWGRGSLDGRVTNCLKKASDGDKACTDSDQCEGVCLPVRSSGNKFKEKGKCSLTIRSSCWTMEDGAPVYKKICSQI